MFKKSTFKKVFKEAISTDLLTSMLIALRDHSTIANVVNILEVIHSLLLTLTLTLTLLTHSLTQSLTHLLTYSFTHSCTHSYSLTHSYLLTFLGVNNFA